MVVAPFFLYIQPTLKSAPKSTLFSSKQNQLKDRSDVRYFKLPYIGNLSHHTKTKLLKLSKEFRQENFNIKLVFDSFKIKNYFHTKT